MLSPSSFRLCFWIGSDWSETLFRFVKGLMNLIDLLGVLPYFFSLAISLVSEAGPGSEEQESILWIE